MIKGILIDIDNTLYDYNVPHYQAMEDVYKFAHSYFNVDNFKKAFKNARNFVHDMLKNTASSHNRLLYFQKTLEELGNHNYILAKDLYDIYWNSFLDYMKLSDGIINFFEKNNDKEICFVTDLTAYIQYRKIEKLGLAKYVKYLVTSEEVGVEKPNRKIFEIALQKINLLPNEVCMIGDSYEKDILGALNLGIKPYWLANNTCDDNRITVFKSFKELEIKE